MAGIIEHRGRTAADVGDGDAAEVKETLPCLLSAETNFHSANANSTYAWYYITQALFHAGDHWCEWNTRLCDQLVGNQDPDGSWGSPGAVAAAIGSTLLRSQGNINPVQ